MPLDLDKLKELGNLPGKVVDAGTEVVKVGAKAVKDWRDTNTERTKDGYHHEENMYKSKTERIGTTVGAAINAIDKLSSSYARVKETYNRRAEIGNVAENNRMKHEEEMAKIMVRVEEVRGKLAQIERDANARTEERRIWLLNHVRDLQEEHARYMERCDEEFFTNETQAWLKDWREAMLEIGKMLMAYPGGEK